MRSRKFSVMTLTPMIIFLVLVASPQTGVFAQDCVDDKGNKIECPPKDPPKDPGNPPVQDNAGENAANNPPNAPN